MRKQIQNHILSLVLVLLVSCGLMFSVPVFGSTAVDGTTNSTAVDGTTNSTAVDGTTNSTAVDGADVAVSFGVEIFDPTGGKSIEQIFQAILDILMVFALPIVVFFIVWAGFLYVTAAGNPEQIKKAHNALLYAVVGGLLVLGANILLAVITNTIEVFTSG